MPATGCLPSRQHAALVGLLLLSCYVYFIPRSGRTDWAASGRADLVLAVADRATLSIDAYHENTGDKAFYRGHYYAVGSIGPSLLALPAYVALRPALNFPPVARYLQHRLDLRGEVTLAPGAHRAATPRERIALIWMTLFAVSLPSACLGVFVYLLACRFAAREGHALILALTYGLGTIAFPYSKALFQHQLSAFGALVGFYLLWRVAREGADRWRLWITGVLFGLVAISEYPVAAVPVLLMGWAALEMNDWRALRRVVWGAIPLLLLFAAYNWAIFDTPLPVGYRYHSVYSDIHQQRFMGFTGPTWQAFYGITLSPYRGLFFLSPVLLLTFPGLALLWRTWHERRLVLLLGGIVLGFVLYVASYLYWSGGDAIGPRFLAPAVPFMILAMVPIFSSWWDRPTGRLTLGALMAVSVLNVWAQSIGGQYYPPYEWRGRIITNPTFQYSLPLLWGGDVAENYGALLGLRGLAGLCPLALLAVCLVLTLRSSNARNGR
jgi:4-amino-4-deoxy-L-arabinose transferase-like glycosyltransferase